MFGLLVIDKPSGPTSRDVVNRIQRRLRGTKVGHAGTLDPLATGVLVIGVGKATRLIDAVQSWPKTYFGTFRLGLSSDTEDISGQTEAVPFEKEITEAQLRSTMAEMRGKQLQLPPKFSALKVNGKRAHKLARAGADFELQPREIDVESLELVSYSTPDFALRTTCSSGTYVRSLGRDIGKRLGTCAVMLSLRREAIGPFTLANAISYEDAEKVDLENHLVPASWATRNLQQVIVSESDARLISFGCPIALPDRTIEVGERVAACNDSNDLLAILVRVGNQLKMDTNFSAAH